MKTNFEMLEDLYRNFNFKKHGTVDQDEIVKIGNILEIAERPLIDCHNLKHFNMFFFEHKIVPIYHEIDKYVVNGHIQHCDKFNELMSKRDRCREVYDAVDQVVEFFIGVKESQEYKAQLPSVG